MLVGDTTVGKTCLITSYHHQSFTEAYEPSVLDIFKGLKQFDKKQIRLEIHDTSGDEHLSANRQISYNKTDCFMLCVSLNQRDRLENLEKWVNEIRTVCSDSPIILVGTKFDLRDENSSDNQSVSTILLKQKSKSLGCQAVCETSSKEYHNHNVSKAFQTAIRTGFYYKYPQELD